MKRRSFLKSSIVTGAAVTVLPAISNAMKRNDTEPAAEYYELSVYTLKDEVQQKLVEDYLKNAAIPFLNRMGIKNIGVFTELKPAGQTKIYVFCPFGSIAQFISVTGKMAVDVEFNKKGSAYLNAPATRPAYERIESSLLKAFAHMQKMSVPQKSNRIFELRQYQSASEAAGKKKIEMFNDRGEIDIFKRLGFEPVFFGETIIGPLRPNLTYMVTFDDLAAKDDHWKAFIGDSQWKEISAVPDYADALLVSKITSTLLVPASCSQI